MTLTRSMSNTTERIHLGTSFPKWKEQKGLFDKMQGPKTVLIFYPEARSGGRKPRKSNKSAVSPALFMEHLLDLHEKCCTTCINRTPVAGSIKTEQADNDIDSTLKMEVDKEDGLMNVEEDYYNGKEEMAEDRMAGVFKTEVDDNDSLVKEEESEVKRQHNDSEDDGLINGEEDEYNDEEEMADDRMAGVGKTEVDNNDSLMKEEDVTFREDEESEEEGHHLDFENDANDSDNNPLKDRDDYSNNSCLDITMNGIGNYDNYPSDDIDGQSDAIPSDSQHADQPDDELSQTDLKRPKKISQSCKKTNKTHIDRIKWQLLPSKCRCKLCEVLCKELTDMKEHIVEMHSNQQVSKPKRKKNNGDKDTNHVNIIEEGLSDFEVSELSIAMRLCPICEQYVKENRIASHLDTHRLKNAICEVCGTACATLSALRRHKGRCTSANNRYKCEDCDGEYSSMASFRTHRYTKHTNKPKVTTQCEICGKELATTNAYRAHLAVHLTVKPYECPECGKGFTQQSNMTYHRRVHTGDKPYKCDMCTEMFAHNVSLKTHKKKKHNIDMWKDG